MLSACSDEKCEQCAKWGASNVINYKTEDYAEVVNSRTQVCLFADSAGIPCRCSPPLHVPHHSLDLPQCCSMLL